MRYLLLFLYPLAFFHYLVYLTLDHKIKSDIDQDVDYMNLRQKSNNSLLHYLVFEKPYRNLFYFRIGRKKAMLLSCMLPEYPLFFINSTMKNVSGAIYILNHPHSTRIFAKSIGKHFTIRQNTTIGMSKINRPDLIPTIGDNVDVGAHSIIIGDIRIGNNVIIGAGSVVVKDIPDNCVVAGNPAKVLKTLPPIE